MNPLLRQKLYQPELGLHLLHLLIHILIVAITSLLWRCNPKHMHACIHLSSPFFLEESDSAPPPRNTEFCFVKLQGMAFYRRAALVAGTRITLWALLALWGERERQRHPARVCCGISRDPSSLPLSTTVSHRRDELLPPGVWGKDMASLHSCRQLLLKMEHPQGNMVTQPVATLAGFFRCHTSMGCPRECLAPKASVDRDTCDKRPRVTAH